jgi:AhpD family alkylhydroperoxidase
MLAPPIALHSPAELPLAASWLMLRESLLATGVVDRATKEHVATAVSLHNTCPYCVQVHDATLRGMTGEQSAGVPESIADPAVRAIARWAGGSGTRTVAGLAPPFPAGQAAEIVGVAVTFHYLNRMANVFLADSPLPPEIPTAARGAAARVLRWFMGSMAGNMYPPGTEAIVSDVLGGLTADGLGVALGGGILLYLIPTDRLAAPNMPKARDAVTAVLGLQRTAPPGDPALLADMRRANAALHARARSVGGASYTHPTAYREALHQDAP